MGRLAYSITGFVALSHICFLVLEMFFWATPTGHRIFNITPEFAAASATLAANQGLYNGFLAAGLIWGLASKRTDVKIFFLSCILLAGLYGGFTASVSILFMQALPAFIALLLVVKTAKAEGE